MFELLLKKNANCNLFTIILQWFVSCFVNMSLKRKLTLTHSNRFFNLVWEEKYLFVDNKGKPQCLVYLPVVSVPKKYNLKRHYETRYKNQFEKYDRAAREAVVKDLKSKYDR